VDTLVPSGDTIQIAATAADNVGVVSVTFELGEHSFTDTQAPYEWSIPAPVVETEQDVSIFATAVDAEGNLGHAERAIRVQPLAPGLGPAVGILCPANDDLVVPGATYPISFTATDDEGVESYTLLVDGEVVTHVSAINQPSVSASPTWVTPVNAPAGAAYLIRVEARDFAGGVGYAQRTLRVPSEPVLLGDQSLSSAVDGQALVLGPGTFTVTEPLEPASLRLLAGAKVAGTTSSGLHLDVAGSLHVQCGGVLSATALGYAGAAASGQQGGAPVGLLGSTRDAGGSHGGVGAIRDLGTPGATYGSVYLPHLGGGGGSFDDDPGGAGGGVLEVRASELVLEGAIESRGGNGEWWGGSRRTGGAGGSVLIDVGTLSGSGLVDASGGDHRGRYTCTAFAGAGGGGRVALYATTLAGFDPAVQVRAWGGGLYNCDGTSWNNRYAGAGTVYAKVGGATYGELYVDSGTEASGVRRLGPDVALPVLGSGTVTAVEVSGGDLWLSQAQPFRSQWLGSWVVLEDATGAELGRYRVLQMIAERVLLEGAAAATGAASFRGEYRFDAVRVRNGARVVIPDALRSAQLELREGEVRLPERVVVEGMTVRSGVVAAATGGRLSIVASGAVVVESGGIVSATSKGYPGGTSTTSGGAPVGLLGSTRDAGGSHGGVGAIRDLGTPGATYGSVYLPHLGGGGGSFDDEPGAAGGGVLEVRASELVLEGVIESRGGEGEWWGGSRRTGGAGGSVVIDVGTLSGSGLVDASGGDHRGRYTCTAFAGAGGGGRVALYATTLAGFDPSVQARAWGGGVYNCDGTSWNNRYAGAGTIYVKTPSSPYGHLYAIQRPGTNTTTPTTPLAVIGSGTVGAIEPDVLDPGDLWIEPQDPTALFPYGAPGMWVRIGATDYPVLAIRADRRRVLLAGAAATVNVGEAYAGRYKLDSVTVNGGFTLQSSDPVDVGTVNLDATSQFVRP
jgi:hypothetical protein